MGRALPEFLNIDTPSSHFLGVAVAALLIVALRVLPPASGHYLLRQPVLFLALYFGARSVLRFVTEEMALARGLALGSVVLLLAA